MEIEILRAGDEAIHRCFNPVLMAHLFLTTIECMAGAGGARIEIWPPAGPKKRERRKKIWAMTKTLKLSSRIHFDSTAAGKFLSSFIVQPVSKYCTKNWRLGGRSFVHTFSVAISDEIFLSRFLRIYTFVGKIFAVAV